MTVQLETLKGIDEIGGYKIADMQKLAAENSEFYLKSGQINWKWFEKNIRPTHFIMFRPDVNSLTFTLRKDDVGITGCEIDALIQVAKTLLEGVNKNNPNHERESAISKLDEVICQLKSI